MAAGDVLPNRKECSSLPKQEEKASQEVKDDAVVSSAPSPKDTKARALASTSCVVKKSSSSGCSGKLSALDSKFLPQVGRVNPPALFGIILRLCLLTQKAEWPLCCGAASARALHQLNTSLLQKWTSQMNLLSAAAIWPEVMFVNGPPGPRLVQPSAPIALLAQSHIPALASACVTPFVFFFFFPLFLLRTPPTVIEISEVRHA